MRFLCCVLLSAIAGAACVAAAPVAFPWMSDALRQPCRKTTLQWRIAANSIRRDEPVTLGVGFALQELSAKPFPNGLLVKAVTTPRDRMLKPGTPRWDRQVAHETQLALNLAIERFGDQKTFGDWRNLYLAFFVGDSLVAVRTRDYYKVADAKLPSNERSALLQELLQQ